MRPKQKQSWDAVVRMRMRIRSLTLPPAAECLRQARRKDTCSAADMIAMDDGVMFVCLVTVDLFVFAFGWRVDAFVVQMKQRVKRWRRRRDGER